MWFSTTKADQKSWLLISGGTIILLVPLFFLSTMVGLEDPTRILLQLFSRSPIVLNSASRFMSAFVAGLLAGWGSTVLALRAWVYDDAPEGVRRCVVLGTLSWFVVDCSGSVLSGNPLNILLNMLFLFVAIGPLWKPADDGISLTQSIVSNIR